MVDVVVELGTNLGLEVSRPSSLVRVDTEAELALAGPEPATGHGFRANLVITTTPVRDEVSIRAAGTRAIAGALALTPEVHVLAYDVYPSHPLAPGRRIEFVYPTPDDAIAVTQWIFLARGHEIVATASRSTADVLASDSTFAFVADSIRWPQ